LVGHERNLTGAQQVGGSICGKRPGEVKTLHLAATPLLQEVALFLGFDSFRDDIDFEFTREADGRADDGGISWSVVQICDEAPCDLDAVAGKPAQVLKGRMTGAKIVDSDGDAPQAEALEKIAML
jgi:hypothetical protein